MPSRRKNKKLPGPPAPVAPFENYWAAMTEHTYKRPSRRNRLTDFLVYSAIALTLVLVALAFAIHQANTGGSPQLPLKWLGFLGMSLIVFGYAIFRHRPEWHRLKFWGLLLLFAVPHFGLGLGTL